MPQRAPSLNQINCGAEDCLFGELKWSHMFECVSKIDFITKCIIISRKVIISAERADLFITDVILLKNSHVPLVCYVHLLLFLL